jgi:transcriptional regulator
MLRAIVGLEISVTRITAKFKGSENRSAADRAGVAAALRAEGRSQEASAEIAANADPGTAA